MKKISSIVVLLILSSIVFSQPQNQYEKYKQKADSLFNIYKYVEAKVEYKNARLHIPKNDNGTKLKYVLTQLELCDLLVVPTCFGTNMGYKSFPANFFDRKNVYHVDLSNNLIENIPSNIGDFGDIKYLKLHHNKISTLPPSMVKLKKIEVLDLSYNKFTEFPYDVINSMNVSNINFTGNDISTIEASKITADLSAKSWTYLGDMMQENKQYPLSKDLYEKALLQDSSYSSAIYGLANYEYYYKRNTQNAIELLKKAISLDDECAKYYKILGIIYFNNKNLDDAIVNFNKYMELTKETIDYNTYLMVAQANFKLSNYASAAMYYSLADSTKTTNDASFKTNLIDYATSCFHAKDYKTAHDIYWRLFKEDHNFDWQHKRAMCIVYEDMTNNTAINYQNAINIFDQNITSNVCQREIKLKSKLYRAYANMKLYEVYGNIYSYNLETAFKDLKQLKNNTPPSIKPTYHVFYACYLSYNENDTTEALNQIEKAINFNYSDVEFLETETLLNNVRANPRFDVLKQKAAMNKSM